MTTNTKPKWQTTIVHACLLLCLVTTTALGQRNDPFVAQRHKMVSEFVIAAGVDDPRVISAIRDIPRHEFVAPRFQSQAYADMALPIGHQQTISSPFIVAFMTQCLDPQPTDRVLEIGTGSGYQAAVLSPLVKDVYSIEIVPELGRQAERTLRRLNYDNVHTKVGDGFQGWPQYAPFDKIIVTCSPEKVPLPLVEQLREGGRIVIPTGERYQQTLYLLRKKQGRLRVEESRPTLFVPMTGTAEAYRRHHPDAAHPQIVNGGFEEAPGDNGFTPGWYYQRNLTWVEGSEAPEGSHFISFENDEVGRLAHLLQGFPLDGRQVRELTITAWVRYEDIWADPRKNDFPTLAITLYDENRRDLGLFFVGRFHGTSNWKKVSKSLRVPPDTREGLVRIGLFGSTGKLLVDDVRIEY